jgi:hypothetical protein
MRGSEKFLRGFNMPAIRRAEIERYACAIDAADTDDFWPGSGTTQTAETQLAHLCWPLSGWAVL